MSKLTERNAQEHIRIYTEDYMGKIFYYCLRKTGDTDAAEDLSQEIALCVLSALSEGNVPEHFPGWVWRVAHNRYAHWARARRCVRETVASEDIYEYDIPDEELLSVEYIHREDLELLRRELAFISSDYRNIVVAYYLRDQSVKQIATDLALPEGTVKTRLFRARTILKEGMNMARTFGKRSYEPENVTFVNNCSSFGANGQPWTILNHLLYKNIFLQAYDNPSTAEELALELGIALPYMEEELNYLVNETFLVCKEGKYLTDFPIISHKAQIQMDEVSRAATRRITTLLEQYIDDNKDALYSGNVSYEEAKWGLLMREFDRYRPWCHHEYPKRPDGGCWEIVGYECTNRREPDFVGQNGVMDTTPGIPSVEFCQYKYNWNRLCDQTPPFLTAEEGYMLYRIAKGETGAFEPACLQTLLNASYIRAEGDGYVATVVLLTNERLPESPALRAAFDEVNATMKDIVRNDLPGRYYSNTLEAQALTDYDRGYVLEQAIIDGWLTYNDQTLKSVGAMLVL